MNKGYQALSKLMRQRSALSFERDHNHNVHLWQRERAGRGADSARCRQITWKLIELEEVIRELDYRCHIVDN